MVSKANVVLLVLMLYIAQSRGDRYWTNTSQCDECKRLTRKSLGDEGLALTLHDLDYLSLGVGPQGHGRPS